MKHKNTVKHHKKENIPDTKDDEDEDPDKVEDTTNKQEDVPDDWDDSDNEPEAGAPEVWDTETDAPNEVSHVIQPSRGNGRGHSGGNRRDESDKVFDPVKEYVPDNTSVLKDYNGHVLPKFKPLPKDVNTGGVTWDKIDDTNLSIIIRRMIAMYVRDKRKYARIIYRQ